MKWLLLLIVLLLLVPVATATLEFNDLDVTVNDKRVSGVGEDGGKIKNVKPGDELTFDMRLRNTYSSSDNIAIEDIGITLTVEDIDDGDDLEEELPDFDISANDDKRKTITITVPSIADEDTYDITILAEGEDEDGNDMEDEIRLELEIEKEDDKLVFDKFQATPDTVDCGETTFLSIEVQNAGKDDQEDVLLKITNNALKIAEERTFSLDEGQTYSDSIQIKIIKTGEHVISGQLSYAGEKETGRAVLKVMKSCEQTSSPEPEPEPEPEPVLISEREEPETVPVTTETQKPSKPKVTITPKTSETKKTAPSVVVKPVEQSSNYTLWVGMELAYLVTFIILFVIIQALMPKKKR